MKRFISVLLVFVMAIIITSCTNGNEYIDTAKFLGQTEKPLEPTVSLNEASPIADRPEFSSIVENDYLKLFVVESGEFSGEFCVVNKVDGSIWYSNPQGRLTNTEDRGVAKMEAFSQLTFLIYNGETEKEDKLNSYTGTKRGERVQVKKIDGGVEILYIFDSLQIAVPLKVRLEGRYLKVDVKTDEIIEQANSHIISMSVLPYFGCADTSDKGYMFVPDGSGALIYNNNGKSELEEYRHAVYGEDPSYRTDKKDSFTEQVYLPVFGADKNSGTYIGIIENGAEDAYINAYVSGMRNSYNNVFAEFILSAQDTVVIGDSSSSQSVSDKRYNFTNRLVDLCTLKYSFLESGSGYAGMAKQYREYLELKLAPDDISTTPPLFLELYGGVKKQESFMGVPSNRLKKLTTVSDAQEIVKNFQDSVDGDIYINYRYLDSSILNGVAQDKLSIQNGLGTQKQLTKLKEMVNGHLYLEFDPFTVTKGGNGYNKYSESAKRIGKDTVVIPSFKLSTLYVDRTMDPISVMTVDSLVNIANKYLSSADKKGFNIAFNTLPYLLYSDFNEDNFVSRGDMAKILKGFFKDYVPEGMISSSNVYLLNSDTVLTGAPSLNSDFDIEDSVVPFYELVISGTREYSLESINLSDNIQAQFLKAAETGASLQFTFVYENVTALRNTRLSGLYGVDFSIWKSQAEQMQQELEKIYKKIGSRILVDSKVLSDGVYCSEFDGGHGIVVNYTDKEVVTDYGKVGAMSYLVI